MMSLDKTNESIHSLPQKALFTFRIIRVLINS